MESFEDPCLVKCNDDNSGFFFVFFLSSSFFSFLDSIRILSHLIVCE